MPKKLLVLLLAGWFLPLPVKAAIDACDASVSPSSFVAGTTGTLTVSITNTDSGGNLLHWVSIKAPSTNFVMSSIDGPSLGSTSVNGDGSQVTAQTTLSSGERGDFNINVSLSDQKTPPSGFVVTAAGEPDGTDAVTCGGDTNVAITSGGVASIRIANVSVAVSDTNANFTWSTGANTTGLVQYGPSASYGQTVEDKTLGTTHAVNILGLTPETNYHYQIVSTDEDGNSAHSADLNFTTAASGATTTVTTVETNTTIETVYATPVPDTAPPVSSFVTDFKKPFAVAPKISGQVRDNKGVAQAEYSLDNGKNWLSVDKLSNVGSTNAAFTFDPGFLEDGNYSIIVRATDINGNVGKSRVQTLVIDRLPPDVGGLVWIVGNQIVNPDASGTVHLVKNVDYQVFAGSTGGPTQVALKLNGKSFPLNLQTNGRLWTGNINLDSDGKFPVQVVSHDGAGNTSQRDLGSVESVSSAQVSVAGARIYVFSRDADLKTFSLWDSSPYGQNNPIFADNSGKFNLILPPGEYYLLVKAKGFEDAVSNIFSLSQVSPIATNFQMKSRTWWFDWGQTEFTIDSAAAVPTQSQSSLVGQELPYFDLGKTSLELRGKPAVLLLTSTWDPQTSSAIQALQNQNAWVILMQQNKSSASIFAKKGGYSLPILADEDGILLKKLNISSLPMYVFVNRTGIIHNILYGVLTPEEIKSNL